MRFRGVLFWIVIAIVAAVLAAAVASISLVIQRTARAELADALVRDRAALQDLVASRDALLAAQLSMVAEEPRLKAVLAAPDVDVATIADVVGELGDSMHAERLALVDPDGKVVIDLDRGKVQPDRGDDWSKRAPVAAALDRGDGANLASSGGRVMQLEARRLTFGTTISGAVVLGYPIDGLPAAFEHETGAGLVVFDGTREVAATSAQLAPVPLVGAEPVEVVLGGVRYVAVAAPLESASGVHAVLLRSLDKALAPSRRAIGTLALVALASLLVAFAVSFGTARVLARPLDALVAFTRRIAAGEPDAATRPRGPRELRQLAHAMNVMSKELGESRARRAAQQRLEQELEIAQTIQTSILPRATMLPNFEIAASMIAASEVGGDYYDVIPAADGCWIGIGDVAGHGLNAGLLMLMVQSTVQGLIRARPDARPSELVALVNAVMFENTRNRLLRDEHVTFTLARLYDDGRMFHAGAHEDIVRVPATGECEPFETSGTWLGAIADVARFTKDSERVLAAGDALVFYTDGLCEARNATGEQLGLERVIAELDHASDRSASALRDAVLSLWKRWTGAQDDDVTIVVVKRT